MKRAITLCKRKETGESLKKGKLKEYNDGNGKFPKNIEGQVIPIL